MSDLASGRIQLMKISTAALVLLVAPFLGSCDQAGKPVVLNQRLFELPSKAATSSACYGFHLKTGPLGTPGGSASGGGGPSGSPLVVGAKLAGDTVVVDVTDNGRIVIQRTYDEAFFESGRVDEFTATGSSGPSVLLRFWGTFDPNGHPACAPSTDDGSRPLGP
jgi:hypothetical protein